MKKIFMILAVAAIAVALPSCGGGKKSEGKKEQKEQKADAAPVEAKAEEQCAYCEQASEATAVSPVEAKAEEFVQRLVAAGMSGNEAAIEQIEKEIEAYAATLSEADAEKFEAAGDAAVRRLGLQ